MDNYGVLEDMATDKLSIYNELKAFVYWLAHNNCNGNVTLMEFEEVAGELFLEVAKGLEHYSHIPADEQVKVIKRMLDNRLGELKYRHYCTHRKEGLNALSIDNHGDDENEETLNIRSEADTETLCESSARVTDTRSLLSPTAQKVFDAIIYGHEDLQIQIWLSTLRASAVYKTHKVQMRSWHIADALKMDERKVRAAMAEIRDAYNTVRKL